MATLSVVQEMNLTNAGARARNAINTATRAFGFARDGVTPQNAASRLVDVLRAWADGIRQVRGDDSLSNATIDAAEQAITDAAKVTVKDLRTAFDAAYAAYRAKLTDLGPMPNANDYAVIRHRIERELGAGVTVETLCADADAETLRVLSAELKSWNRAQHPSDRQLADQLTERDAEFIRRRAYALATPAERARMDSVEAAERGKYRTDLAFGQVEHALVNLTGFTAVPQTVLVPQWEVGSEVTVTL